MKLSLSSTILFLALCVFSFTNAQAQQSQQKVDNAPKVVPPATEEMQHPEFWIARLQNPDAVVLNPQQIAELNKKNLTRPYDLKDVNGNPFSFLPTVINKDNTVGVQFYLENPLSMKSFPGDSLRVRLQRHSKSINFARMYDRRRMRYDELEIKEVEDRINTDAIANTITPRYGILVAHTLNRALPTNEAGYGSPDGWIDSIQSTALDAFSPVAVLHASPNADWYYARSELAFGWIPAVNVAFGSPKEIENYMNSKDFIVSLVHKVPLYSDKEFKNFATDLYMGEKAKLTKKTSEGYQVVIPVRKGNASLEFITGWVKPDAKVNVGYQSYTQRNILNTIFSLLYRPYGWADQSYERDCCGTQRVVLRTFGILTGRWTTHELHSSDHVYAFPRNTPKEEKYKYLATCEPAITLIGNPGHIIMYIGTVDGKYFVIHQGGYSYTDDQGVRRAINRVNVNDTELEGGSNVNQWSEITEMKP
ncbi:MAG: SH3 domain-containing protein [Candidatus Latescibacter sp.]|nr:SH3 domain-containing protein [Candidatus Latescibacter sp.]